MRRAGGHLKIRPMGRPSVSFAVFWLRIRQQPKGQEDMPFIGQSRLPPAPESQLLTLPLYLSLPTSIWAILNQIPILSAILNTKKCYW
jgi:hypothetical protein